jgi:hypothetical protein
VSVKAVEHGTQRIWFIFSTILFEYTQEEIITLKNDKTIIAYHFGQYMDISYI